MSAASDVFHGWLGLDRAASQGQMTWSPFSPKTFSKDDVDVQISHCGICGTDLHTLRSGWGNTHYPVCVGHEIVGHVVRIGSCVQHLDIGARVGIGAQAFSCLKHDCAECSRNLEQHCPNSVSTYNSKYPDGSWSMGGFATHIRVPAHFAIEIPTTLSSAHAAPMMCGGITVYSPLRKYGAGPGKRVGIIGLGGLGHFGVLFAKAMDADAVVVISRKRNKEKDARTMGADEYIATDEDERWARKHTRSLDLIVCTVSSPDMPLESYMRLLRTDGYFIQVGAPEDKLPSITAFALIGKACHIGGSQIGSPDSIREMLQFAASKTIQPWVQVRNMQDANQSIVDMEEGHARYRYVLRNGSAYKL